MDSRILGHWRLQTGNVNSDGRWQHHGAMKMATSQSNRAELRWWRVGEGVGVQEKDTRAGGISPLRKNTNVKPHILLHICTV
jgi:hypothetical protein